MTPTPLQDDAMMYCRGNPLWLPFMVKYQQNHGSLLIVRSLPTYCSELNLIEILWRFIKYHWLPFSAYLSLDNLRKELDNILKNFGSEFIINFAD